MHVPGGRGPRRSPRPRNLARPPNSATHVRPAELGHARSAPRNSAMHVPPPNSAMHVPPAELGHARSAPRNSATHVRPRGTRPCTFRPRNSAMHVPPPNSAMHVRGGIRPPASARLHPPTRIRPPIFALSATASPHLAGGRSVIPGVGAGVRCPVVSAVGTPSRDPGRAASWLKTALRW